MAFLLLITLMLEHAELSSPGVLMTLSFVIVSACCLQGLNSWNTVELKWDCIGIIILGLVTFLTTGYLIRAYIDSVHRSRKGREPLFSIDSLAAINETSVNVVIIITLLASSFYYIDVVRHLIQYGYSIGDFSSLSSGYHDLGFSYGIAARSQLGTLCYIYCYCAGLLLAFLFITRLYEKKLTKKNAFKLIIAFVISLLPLAITGLRTYIGHIVISIMIGTVLFGIVKTGRRPKVIVVAIIVCVAFPLVANLFYSLLEVVGRMTDLQLDPVSYLTYYLGISIPNFQMYLDGSPRIFVGFDELFSAFHTTLYQLHLASQPGGNSSLDFLAGGSNVYTLFKPAYHDFGLPGVILYSSLLACLFYGLYESFKYSHDLYTFSFYSLISFMLVESIRDDFVAYWFGLNILYYIIVLALIIGILFHKTGSSERRPIQRHTHSSAGHVARNNR
jgi:oligosaccharide repeat unit polymerase